MSPRVSTFFTLAALTLGIAGCNHPNTSNQPNFVEAAKQTNRQIITPFVIIPDHILKTVSAEKLKTLHQMNIDINRITDGQKPLYCDNNKTIYWTDGGTLIYVAKDYTITKWNEIVEINGVFGFKKGITAKMAKTMIDSENELEVSQVWIEFSPEQPTRK